MMKTVLGTMTFADQVDSDATRSMLELFVENKHSELDTANVYNDGKTETLLGELIPSDQRKELFIASKVHPWNDHGLQPAQVTKQINESTYFICILPTQRPRSNKPWTPVSRLINRASSGHLA